MHVDLLEDISVNILFKIESLIIQYKFKIITKITKK
jgi:hypothetical protein